MQAKPVKDSTITIVYQMTHQDANLAGNVHGGVILKDIDNTAGIVASRHANTNAVTASIDRVDFYSPVYVGDLLRLLASVNYTGRTSMEVGVRVEAENFMTGEVRHTASAYLSFVAWMPKGVRHRCRRSFWKRRMRSGETGKREAGGNPGFAMQRKKETNKGNSEGTHRN